MNKGALADYVQALADDELILGHRDSEWCGHAPILEEDIAFANIALDEIGHARLWLELSSELRGQDPATYPDQQVFFRSAPDYRCLPLVELPNGDWAFSMLRQYLFDAFEFHRLTALKASPHPRLAEVSTKILTEEIYHLRHTQAWVTRLGLGTDESQARMQAALDALWPFAQGLAAALPGEADLMQDRIVPPTGTIYAAWLGDVKTFLKQANLVIADEALGSGGRTEHSEHLVPLLEDMQTVARWEPEGSW